MAERAGHQLGGILRRNRGCSGLLADAEPRNRSDICQKRLWSERPCKKCGDLTTSWYSIKHVDSVGLAPCFQVGRPAGAGSVVLDKTVSPVTVVRAGHKLGGILRRDRFFQVWLRLGFGAADLQSIAA